MHGAVSFASCQIENPALREYFDHLQIVTQSPRLFSLTRFRAIWDLNSGHHDDLIDACVQSDEWTTFVRNAWQ